MQVGASRMQVGASRVQVGASRMRVGASRMRVGASRMRVGASRMRVGASRVQVGASRMRVGASRMQVGAKGASISRNWRRRSCTLSSSANRFAKQIPRHGSCSFPAQYAGSETVSRFDCLAARGSNTGAGVQVDGPRVLRARSQAPFANGRCRELGMPQHCGRIRVQAQGVRSVSRNLASIVERVGRFVSHSATEKVCHRARLRTHLAVNTSSVPSICEIDPVSPDDA